MSKQTKTLTILTVAMLLLNVVLLGIIFVDGDDHRHGERTKKHRSSREHFEHRMSKRLGLDEQQKEAYEKLHKSHKKEFWEISKAIFDVKKKIGESLAIDQETEARVLLTTLDSLHQVREQKYFDHTRAIFDVFNSEQRQKFLETLNKVGDDHRKKRRRKGD